MVSYSHKKLDLRGVGYCRENGNTERRKIKLAQYRVVGSLSSVVCQVLGFLERYGSKIPRGLRIIEGLVIGRHSIDVESLASTA
jgi:hypothetical protein